MNRTLNWGLLSTARINRALIKPLRASKRTRLLGVASRSLSNAQAYAREWDIPRAYGSYDDLLNDPEIDIIYNPLPNHLHAGWTIKTLKAGKHVLCEKPLALSLEEVDEIIAASKETGRIATEAFMYRHHEQTLKVKALTEEGAIGKLQLIRGAFTFTLAREGNYRFVKEYGGGSLWDVGCYPVSYARMIVGAEPAEVFGWQVAGAALSESKDPGGYDESFYGQARFENGAILQFDCGFKSQIRTFIEIVGSEGTIHIPNPFKPGLKNEIHLKRGDREETLKIAGSEPYRGEVEDMRDAILNNAPPRISLADSRGNTAVLLSLLESAKLGAPIRLR
ncbi:MAG: gfo/Idh/MocA family oxidoreductase [Chloroflexi bacterium CFX1]|nr:gfo/Idh/MocA family oxidoreductase [Chloroflexi bacterium CFX1]MCQ3952879.1 gfo/Idh/MocA family oxidoreductase [Chloroflexota bacterium]MDL1917694.1 Gfo/Idh/MocA family oxidoreductase [Chloroflexi bacterium CFX5]